LTPSLVKILILLYWDVAS